ncbi:MAG: DNA double-strand break repair protein Mre11, partial [Cyanobacteria bacterium P01_H01_bin.26]
RDPLSALQTYLASRDDLVDLTDDMLLAAQTLLQADPTSHITESAAEVATTSDEHNQQLRLL